jgi:glycosyltransferase involved in cell wall biosynthesis
MICLNHSRLKGFFLNLKEVQLFIDKNEIDIVHSHGFRADMINTKLRGVISVNTIHNFPDEDYIKRYGYIVGSWMSRTHKRAFDRIQVPVSCSKTVRSKLLNTSGIETSSIQNGIDIEKFGPPLKAKKELRQMLNLPLDKELFIVCGALTRLKNPEVIIRAFTMLNQRKSLLLFIGKGELLDSLSRANNNADIRFIGSVENVKEYLQASDYYVSASLTEGLPNSVLEALSVGLPLILSNIPSHSEIVGDPYPYLFDPGKVEDLKEKLEMARQNGCNQDNEANAGGVVNHFTASRMSEDYQQLYFNAFKRAKNQITE